MFKSPKEIAEDLAARVQKRRIQLNITQRELAERSGVSFGSVKRFEQKGEISLKHLLQIAIVLRLSDEMEQLFAGEEYTYQSMDQLIQDRESEKYDGDGDSDSNGNGNGKMKTPRKRARR